MIATPTASDSSRALVSYQPSSFLARCFSRAMEGKATHGRHTGKLRPLPRHASPSPHLKATVSAPAPLVPGSAADPGKPGLDSPLVQRLRASLFGSGQVAASPSIAPSVPARTAPPAAVGEIPAALAAIASATTSAEKWRACEHLAALERGETPGAFASSTTVGAELAKLDAALASEKNPKARFQIAAQREAVENGSNFVSPEESRAAKANLENQLSASTCPRERYRIAEKLNAL